MKVQVKDKSVAYASESVEFRETKDGKEEVLFIFDECLHENVVEEFDNLYCANEECNVMVAFEHEWKGEDDFDRSDNLREQKDDRGY